MHDDEVANLLERLLAEHAARAQFVDRGERLLLASGDDLAGRRGPDAGQRLELGGRRGVQVHEAARPAGLRSAAGRRTGRIDGRRGIVPGWDPHLVAIGEQRREVQVATGTIDVNPGL